jgi:dihydroorotase
MFDLVLHGGRVIDPARGVDARLDVAFAAGKIAEVGPDLPDGRQTRDVSGLIVVPGLIDRHTHVYGGGTSLGVDPDAYARASGLTTLINAGSTEPGNLKGFRRRVIERSEAQGRFVFEDVLGEELNAEQRLGCRGIVLGARWWHE